MAIAVETDIQQDRRIDLILRQIETLPTLPAVATRLLSLTVEEDAQAREVVQLVGSDPALTAKILSICRSADLGIRSETLTVERAVMLLGFSAVRNAVLSIQVFDIFDEMDEQRHAQDAPAFDRTMFFRHCLAVAIAAELLAEANPHLHDLPAGEAFVCGLLHDIGKLALDHVLPKAYARAVELVELNQGSIAEYERRIIGMDHHTAGKRLAEQWQLSHQLQDCVWLHGSDYSLLPDLAHRRMVGLVSLADLIARQQHLGYSGNFQLKQDARKLAEQIGLRPDSINLVLRQLHDELESRSKLLGLDDTPSAHLLMESIQHANSMLGKLNTKLEERSRATTQQARVLESITQFTRAQTPGMGVVDVLQLVVQCATPLFGHGFYGMLYQPAAGQPWLVVQFNREGYISHQQLVDPPPHTDDLAAIDVGQPMSINLVSIVPWIADYLVQADDLRNIRMLPLGSGWGVAAVMLHDQPKLPDWRQLQSLTGCWGSAIAAANQHESARRLGEQLANANRALAEAQDRLLQTQSMARLGEMAAGAAHEMNNPLAVISGRSQMLVGALSPGSPEFKAARAMVEQSHRLSDLISALRMFADPPKPVIVPTNLAVVVDSVVRHLNETMPHNQRTKPFSVNIHSDVSDIPMDGEQIGECVKELLLNAVQSGPKSDVTVDVTRHEEEHMVRISVKDDGCGMDSHTLEHAFDPFFSVKKAGRQVGVGLAKVRQYVTAHNGSIDLRSTEGKGTKATIKIPLD